MPGGQEAEETLLVPAYVSSFFFPSCIIQMDSAGNICLDSSLAFSVPPASMKD